MDMHELTGLSVAMRGPGVLKNTLDNLRTMLETERQYVCAAQSIRLEGSVIIAGAGPSLTEAIPHLLKAECPIWCVNTAFPALKAAGVKVDRIIALEQIDVSDHLKEAEGVRIISSPIAAPQAVASDATSRAAPSIG
jgi:hypothetical protein